MAAIFSFEPIIKRALDKPGASIHGGAGTCAANPEARREALTSRPLLLAAVGRAAHSAGQTTLYLTPMHAEVGLINPMIANVHAAIRHVRAAAQQLPGLGRWKLLGRGLGIAAGLALIGGGRARARLRDHCGVRRAPADAAWTPCLQRLAWPAQVATGSARKRCTRHRPPPHARSTAAAIERLGLDLAPGPDVVRRPSPSAHADLGAPRSASWWRP